MSINGGTAVAKAEPEDLDLRIGRPIAFHLEITPQSPSDRLHPGQPGRASGVRLLSSHHQCTGKTHRNHVKFTLVKDVGEKLATAEEIRTSQR